MHPKVHLNGIQKKKNHWGSGVPQGLMPLDTVADDSLLHQAIKLKLKGNKQACQDRQPSLTRRQVTRLHFKTIAECLKPLYLCSR
jgi:hypothetical protein